MPEVRKAVLKCGKYGKPDLPEELKGQEFITVYRAGRGGADKAKYQLSWTTDKRVAFWFYRLYGGKHADHVWQAQIRPKDVIGYMTIRNESEVIQHGKVRNLVDITAEADS